MGRKPKRILWAASRGLMGEPGRGYASPAQQVSGPNVSKWYCECGQCEDCSDEPIELHSLDGSVQYVEKETREQWLARVLAMENK